jgi:3-deoxy-D-manno-octulosonic-acid transferase
MPLDTKSNAERIIKAIKPDVAVMTKYDLWKNHLEAAKTYGSKLILFAARFTSNQYFFKPYGTIGREMLKLFDAIHVQENSSQQLLESIKINSENSGDTRYDRVMAHAQIASVPHSITEFCSDNQILIAGSTWPEGEEMLAKSRKDWPEDLKVIIAPHDISERHISSIVELFPDAVRFSKMNTPHSQILILDNIGLLSSVYKVADVAYVGGAFGTGLHNILEEAAGFATKLQKPAGFSDALNSWLEKDKIKLQQAIQEHTKTKTGATEKVVAAIHDLMLITPDKGA